MIFWWIIGLLVLIVGYFLVVILMAMFFQYQPEKEVELHFQSNDISSEISKNLTVYTWNIGYAGLDQDADFFYDGGEMMRPTKKRVLENVKGIMSEIKSWKDADIVLLQEVDESSKRSWFIPLKENLQLELKNQFPHSVFAKNYDVRYVPIPIFQPLGKVRSGLLTMSKFSFSMAKRIAYPANFPFPKGLFFLKRCFLVTSFPFNNKELFIINTHNSAFDGGVLKAQEMEVLKAFILNVYAKGNYVIVGGDWNQVPLGFEKGIYAKYEETSVPENFPDRDWKWVTDIGKRTNRKVDKPYVEGKTYTTTFDFFLLSPNIEKIKVECLDRKFQYSDHQPVKIQIQLKD